MLNLRIQRNLRKNPVRRQVLNRVENIRSKNTKNLIKNPSKEVLV